MFGQSFQFLFGFVLLFVSSSGLASKIVWVDTTIEHSLGRTLSKATNQHGPALAAQVERLLGWKGNVARDLRAKDRLIVGYKVVGGEPQLTSAFYRGGKLKLDAMLFNGGDGVERFYDRQAKLVESQLSPNPVPDYIQVTERVQTGRGRRRHKGIDLKAAVGSPILSPVKGVVNRINWNTRYNGKCVEIRDRNGNTHRFLHLHRVAKLKAGQTVGVGQDLGQVGNTGRSSAPHLHYEITDSKGRVVNPLTLIGGQRPSVSQPLKASFNTKLQKILRRFSLVSS
jgi:murein DD-endopeptidase